MRVPEHQFKNTYCFLKPQDFDLKVFSYNKKKRTRRKKYAVLLGAPFNDGVFHPVTLCTNYYVVIH